MKQDKNLKLMKRVGLNRQKLAEMKWNYLKVNKSKLDINQKSTEN